MASWLLERENGLRTADLLLLSVAALWQQKVRSALTTLGVILGSCMLAMSLSVGTGVQEAVRNEFRKNDRLRRIEVHVGSGENQDDETGIPAEVIEVQGEMSPERRQRTRKYLVRRWHQLHSRHGPIPLTPAMIQRLKDIEHVEEVVPGIYESGRLAIAGKTLPVSLQNSQRDLRGLQRQIVFGTVPAAKDSRAVVVHEQVLYDLGIRDDAEIERLLGQPVHIEIANDWRSPRQLLTLLDAQAETLTTEEIRILQKVLRLLPTAFERLDLTGAEKEKLRQMLERRDPFASKLSNVVAGEDFTVVGVYRSLNDEELKRLQFYETFYQYTDVVVSYETAERFCEKLPRRRDGGFDSLTVYVDHEENVGGVVNEVHKIGVRYYSAVEFVEHILREVQMIRFATAFISGIALLVAALGIANTMVTSVLERTQEIGIMKAVGAKERYIQLMFLLEGAILGLLGGGLGLLAAWLFSLPGDRLARKLMEQQTNSEVTQALFVFPFWLLLTVPLFAVLITTLASVYPARRAARVDPIAALRHE